MVSYYVKIVDAMYENYNLAHTPPTIKILSQSIIPSMEKLFLISYHITGGTQFIINQKIQQTLHFCFAGWPFLKTYIFDSNSSSILVCCYHSVPKHKCTCHVWSSNCIIHDLCPDLWFGVLSLIIKIMNDNKNFHVSFYFDVINGDKSCDHMSIQDLVVLNLNSSNVTMAFINCHFICLHLLTLQQTSLLSLFTFQSFIHSSFYPQMKGFYFVTPSNVLKPALIRHENP